MKAKVTPCKGRSNRAFLLLPLQGATAPTRDTQGAASLALGYEEHWAFIGIIGCGSAIQASLIAFALHDDSARTC
ncbi:hypothetical protein [Prevotellamassilia timonensis]|uniref:hypothetical protein n=1 Tax=Prevotellamassilia timonensis TaxID=1852370 RepID=UPI0008DA7F16|nr:hypothetical protein [Prevotellamassilia timonensis]